MASALDWTGVLGPSACTATTAVAFQSVMTSACAAAAPQNDPDANSAHASNARMPAFLGCLAEREAGPYKDRAQHVWEVRSTQPQMLRPVVFRSNHATFCGGKGRSGDCPRFSVRLVIFLRRAEGYLQRRAFP